MDKMIQRIWQYSNYYGDMLATVRLHDEGEGYAATLVLFNATELICKSIRENYNQNFSQDLSGLQKNGLLSEDDYEFLSNNEFGVRGIRNKMIHSLGYIKTLQPSINIPFMKKKSLKQKLWTQVQLKASQKAL
ncbi:hypothetical protein [Pseudogracilibacillus auburnensis]|uniref:hypothetical protein n=1 Tax=Pseudogracilibacillus auburnensis TaxID=1494959 RepID=UPI001A96E5A5|nr:hypothetical protein [Pseudogracilibacillus auburnensis]MBO1004563.1 hypothetical protein [Pseudogracilibacillus auburnensis]